MRFLEIVKYPIWFSFAHSRIRSVSEAARWCQDTYSWNIAMVSLETFLRYIELSKYRFNAPFPIKNISKNNSSARKNPNSRIPIIFSIRCFLFRLFNAVSFPPHRLYNLRFLRILFNFQSQFPNMNHNGICRIIEKRLLPDALIYVLYGKNFSPVFQH